VGVRTAEVEERESMNASGGGSRVLVVGCGSERGSESGTEMGISICDCRFGTRMAWGDEAAGWSG
jgi:hypothetical protein